MALAANVKTVLNGNGSDSLFAGSNSHLVSLAASLCRRGRVIRACTMLANAASGHQRAHLFKSVIGTGLPSGIKAVLRPRAKPYWLNDGWFQDRNTGARIRASESVVNLRTQLLRELQTLSLPYTLRFEEHAAEAHNVCSHSPFLAPEVIEFAFSLPEELLIGSDGYTKSVLRSAGRDMLPKTILESRDRMGFPVPADEWLRSLREWASEELMRARDLPFIDASEVRRSWELFQRPDGYSWQRAMEIWRLVFLARWVKVFSAQF